MDPTIIEGIQEPTNARTGGRPINLARASIRQISDHRVKGTSTNNLSEAVMVDNRLDTARKGRNYAPTAKAHTRIMTVILHGTELCDSGKSHKRHYNELQSGQVPDSRCYLLINNEEIQIACQDGKRWNRQNSATIDLLPPFKMACVQPSSRPSRNCKGVKVGPSC